MESSKYDNVALNELLTPLNYEISKKEVDELGIIRDEFHGEWNYTFKPRNKDVAEVVL
jgi:hypothetical protein